MFEHEIAGTPIVAEFLQVWQAFKAETADKIRLSKLEIQVDNLWEKLTQAQKDAIWMEYFPEQRKIKEVFEAHAVKL